MNAQDFNMHFVCTLDEAGALINQRDRYWVSNCGCRESRGFCARSRLDVCLMFRGDYESSSSGMKEISYGEVDKILQEARDKHLVARPFRDVKDRTTVDGICFCCDDCCGYFLNSAERCDPGTYIEITQLENCTHCGICVEVCYFKARKMVGGEMLVDREKCYGCGLCIKICPEECIEMMPRHLNAKAD